MRQLVVILIGLGLFGAEANAESPAVLVDRADMAHRGQTSAEVVSVVKILGPAFMRGHGTLKLDRPLELYDPETNRVTVVGHSMLGDSWMGSHFPSDDLVEETRSADDFVLTLEKNWQQGGATHYRVEMTPRPEAPVPWGAAGVFRARSL